MFNPKDKKEENEFKKMMKIKAKSFSRAETAFSRCTDAEKIFINSYLNDPEMSVGQAVVKCGLADNMEDAVSIGMALLNNKTIQSAINEIKALGGLTPSRIKEKVMQIVDIAMERGDLITALNGLKQAGKYLGMENAPSKQVEERTPIEVEEMKRRVVGTLTDAVSEAEDFVAALKSAEKDKIDNRFNYEYESDEEISKDIGFEENSE